MRTFLNILFWTLFGSVGAIAETTSFETACQSNFSKVVCDIAGAGANDCYEQFGIQRFDSPSTAVSICRKATSGFKDCYHTYISKVGNAPEIAQVYCMRADSNFLSCFQKVSAYQPAVLAITLCGRSSN